MQQSSCWFYEIDKAFVEIHCLAQCKISTYPFLILGQVSLLSSVSISYSLVAKNVNYYIFLVLRVGVHYSDLVEAH